MNTGLVLPLPLFGIICCSLNGREGPEMGASGRSNGYGGGGLAVGSVAGGGGSGVNWTSEIRGGPLLLILVWMGRREGWVFACTFTLPLSSFTMPVMISWTFGFGFWRPARLNGVGFIATCPICVAGVTVFFGDPDKGSRGSPFSKKDCASLVLGRPFPKRSEDSSLWWPWLRSRL